MNCTITIHPRREVVDAINLHQTSLALVGHYDQLRVEAEGRDDEQAAHEARTNFADADTLMIHTHSQLDPYIVPIEEAYKQFDQHTTPETLVALCVAVLRCFDVS